MLDDITILVIDDDAVLSMQMEKLLGQAGCKVLFAANGLEGVEKAKKHVPSLILLDRQMPAMDGNGVLIALKSCVETKAIPVIMLTGDQMLSDIETSYDLGACDYVVKPVRDRDDFLARVKKALGRDSIKTAI